MNKNTLIYETNTFQKFDKIFKNFRNVSVIFRLFDSVDLVDLCQNGKVNGIIIGGSTSRILTKTALKLPQKIFTSGIPILGICYGFQLMMQNMCSSTAISTFPNSKENKRRKYLTIELPNFKVSRTLYYFIHHDYITKIPKSWKKDIVHGDEIWMAHYKKHIGIQFHPEKFIKTGKMFFEEWIKFIS